MINKNKQRKTAAMTTTRRRSRFLRRRLILRASATAAVAVAVVFHVLPTATIATSATMTGAGAGDDNTASKKDNGDCNFSGDNACVNRNSEHEDTDLYTDKGKGKDEHENKYERHEIDWCRRRPTWRRGKNNKINTNDENDVRERCQRVLRYRPDFEQLVAGNHPYLSSSFDFDVGVDEQAIDKEEDEAKGKEDELPVMERPLIRKLIHCMDNTLTSSEEPPLTPDSNNNNNNTVLMPRPIITRLYKREADRLPVMAVVEHALSEEEAQSVIRLTGCLRRHVPDLFEERKFENTAKGSGNDVTFLAGFLQLLTPGVAIQIKNVAHLVWKEAKWGDDEMEYEPIDTRIDDKNIYKPSRFSNHWWPDPFADCGIRTTEHLSYDRWGGLGYHQDSGSDYTVLVSLSDPNDYEGGDFTLFPEHNNENYDPQRKISFKPNRLSAIVFLSEFSHGVEDIHTPGRVTMANELWRYGDVPTMVMRPRHEFVIEGDDDDVDDVDDDDYDDYDYDDDIKAKRHYH